MEYERKFEEFSNIVLKEASDEKQKMLADVRAKISEANKKLKDELIKKAEQNLKLETEKTVRLKNENVSKAIMESRRKIIEKREQLLESMHVAVKNRLLEFKKSDRYMDWILKQIENAQKQLNDTNVTVYIGKCDQNIFDNLIQKTKVKLKVDDNIKIGGCKVISDKKRMLVDSTFEKRIEEAFSDFHQLSIKI